MVRIIISFLLLFCFSSCSRKAEDPVIAKLQRRNMQTKTFVGYDAKKVTKEVIALLQDEGYMIKNMSNDLGLITAERDVQIEKTSEKFWAYIFSGKRARWKKHSLVEMTANVTEERGNTKVRINFVVRIFDNFGRIVEVHPLLEEESYKDFFAKVHASLLAT
jgi:hypothetical protein